MVKASLPSFQCLDIEIALCKMCVYLIVFREKQEVVEPEVVDERLKHIDPKMIELIESEIIDKGTPIG